MRDISFKYWRDQTPYSLLATMPPKKRTSSSQSNATKKSKEDEALTKADIPAIVKAVLDSLPGSSVSDGPPSTGRGIDGSPATTRRKGADKPRSTRRSVDGAFTTSSHNDDSVRPEDDDETSYTLSQGTIYSVVCHGGNL